MLDFVTVALTKTRDGTVVRPEFITYKGDGEVKDIMVKGGDFYAFWDENKTMWNRNEHDAYREIDKSF